jgi:hypothetical protein
MAPMAAHDHPTAVAPMSGTMAASMLPLELPPVLTKSLDEGMGSHLAMACVAILVGLLLLAAASLRRIRTHLPPSMVQAVLRPVLRWPPPPDLAQLSILRT